MNRARYTFNDVRAERIFRARRNTIFAYLLENQFSRSRNLFTLLPRTACRYDSNAAQRLAKYYAVEEIMLYTIEWIGCAL